MKYLIIHTYSYLSREFGQELYSIYKKIKTTRINLFQQNMFVYPILVWLGVAVISISITRAHALSKRLREDYFWISTLIESPPLPVR